MCYVLSATTTGPAEQEITELKLNCVPCVLETRTITFPSYLSFTSADRERAGRKEKRSKK